MMDRRDGGERAWEMRGVLSSNWFGSLAGRKQGKEGEGKGGENKNIGQSIKHILKT